MLAADGSLLYVGKAQNLRRRVASYFSARARDAKTMALMNVTSRVEVTVTETEADALLLEYNLIKEHRPRFNVVLRDDKSYPYIHVSVGQEFPRFEFHRGSRRGAGRYLGPFPNAGAVRVSLQQLQKLFRVRNCTDSYFAQRSRPCLQHQLGRCTAPCVGLIDPAEYRRDVTNAIAFVEGKDRDVENDLAERMEACAAREDYEQAALYRDRIKALRRVQAQQVVSVGGEANLDAVGIAGPPGAKAVALLMLRGGRLLGSREFHPRSARGTADREILAAFLGQHYLVQPAPAEILLPEKVEGAGPLAALLSARNGHVVAIRHAVRGRRRRWLEMAAGNATAAAALRAAGKAGVEERLAALARELGLSAAPGRIECFDISHLAGGETVGSCVVFGEDGPVKSDYRRFNIRATEEGDDYAAMREVLERRYRKLSTGEARLPDVVLVDGGKGQLAQAISVIGALGIDVTLLAVAKGEGRKPGRERLFLAGRSRPIVLPPDSAALHLIQQIRDEAHRFAITGHRQRRSRQKLGSVLEQLPGLGPQRRRALLKRFGGLQGVARAGVEDLARTPGVSRALAERLYDYLRDEVPVSQR